MQLAFRIGFPEESNFVPMKFSGLCVSQYIDFIVIRVSIYGEAFRKAIALRPSTPAAALRDWGRCDIP